VHKRRPEVRGYFLLSQLAQINDLEWGPYFRHYHRLHHAPWWTHFIQPKALLKKKMKKQLGWAHLSAGDCLRAERKNPDSEYGGIINSKIEAGEIVPVEITVKLLIKAMEASGK
jgi:hypothetical protein